MAFTADPPAAENNVARDREMLESAPLKRKPARSKNPPFSVGFFYTNAKPIKIRQCFRKR
jgi:hypothetical protein